MKMIRADIAQERIVKALKSNITQSKKLFAEYAKCTKDEEEDKK